MTFGLSTTIFLISYLLLSIKIVAQDAKLADSLIYFLDAQNNLNDRQKAKIHGKIAHEHPNTIMALSHAEKSLKLAVSLGDLILQAEALEELSVDYRLLGYAEASFTAALEALDIYENLGLIDKQAAVFTQIGSSYVVEEDYIQALHYLNRGLKIYQISSDLKRAALTQINMGEAHRLMSSLDSAEYYFTTALKINISLKNKIVEGYSTGNLGMVHGAQGKVNLAIEEMSHAIDLLIALGDPYSVSVYEAEIGQLLIQQGGKEEGEQKLLNAIATARKENLKEQIRDFSAMLSSFYENEGLLVKALAYQREYQIYQDSLVNRENVRKIEQLRGQHELDKKEAEISFLNQTNSNQKRLAYGLGGGVGVFLLLSFLLYQNNQQKRKANILLTEQKAVIQKREDEKVLLLKELNHRVKNNLQMISSLLNLQSHELETHPAVEAVTAGKYRVEAMSLIHQKLYQEDHHIHIPMKDYIEELVRNLRYSFGQNIELVFDIEDMALNIDRAIPIALIINELVTNALKYAFTDLKAGQLSVHLIKSEGNIELLVSDNGRGMHSAGKTANSFGLKLVHSLADQLHAIIEMSQSLGTHWKLTMELNIP